MCTYHEKRSKFDDKINNNFIDYDANSKGYKLYNHNTRKTIIIQHDFKGEWGWGPHDGNYNFFPCLEEDD